MITFTAHIKVMIFILTLIAAALCSCQSVQEIGTNSNYIYLQLPTVQQTFQSKLNTISEVSIWAKATHDAIFQLSISNFGYHYSSKKLTNSDNKVSIASTTAVLKTKEPNVRFYLNPPVAGIYIGIVIFCSSNWKHIFHYYFYEC